jgi:putative sterol carrier protein
MIEDDLVSLVDRFNRHTQKNPGTLAEVKDLTRTIEIRFTDGETYQIRLKDGMLSLPFKGDGVSPEVKITTDTKTFQGLVKKEIGPMKALVTRKLVIDASLEDKILLRRLL